MLDSVAIHTQQRPPRPHRLAVRRCPGEPLQPAPDHRHTSRPCLIHSPSPNVRRAERQQAGERWHFALKFFSMSCVVARRILFAFLSSQNCPLLLPRRPPCSFRYRSSPRARACAPLADSLCSHILTRLAGLSFAIAHWPGGGPSSCRPRGARTRPASSVSARRLAPTAAASRAREVPPTRQTSYVSRTVQIRAGGI